ncbi:MAG: acyltransferase [Bacteroidales bacterium]|nr:acyltransferase [Bacteroidales bacterium]
MANTLIEELPKVQSEGRDEMLTKQESKILQGVAFILMLFLHLFCVSKNVEMCKNSIFFGDIPLVSLLARAANPVAMFLIISGYGQYVGYKKGAVNYREYLKKQLIRVLKLYICYWITLIIFVGLGCFIAPQKYPGSWVKMVGNVIGYRYTYNAESWFLLPYSIISLLSYYLFRLKERLGNLFSFISAFLLSIVAVFLISRVGEKGMARPLYLLTLVASFILPFLLGVFIYSLRLKELVHRVLRSVVKRCGLAECLVSPLALSLLIALIICRIIINTDILNSFYALAFILLFVNIKRGKTVDKILYALGLKCLVMWLIHTYFCYYLFHDFIYGLRYPALIYIVMLLLSYIVSIPIDYAAKQVAKRVIPE